MQKVLIDNVSVTTTSDPINVENITNLVAQLIRANHSAGSHAFTFDGSNDGTNWVTGIAVLSAVATAVGTYVTSVTLNSDSTAAVYIPSGWKMIRAVATETTDGTASVILCGTKLTT